jgi:hypothetical protein
MKMFGMSLEIADGRSPTAVEHGAMDGPEQILQAYPSTEISINHTITTSADQLFSHSTMCTGSARYNRLGTSSRASKR